MKLNRGFSNVYDLLIDTGIGDGYLKPLPGAGVLTGDLKKCMMDFLDELPANYLDDSVAHKLVIGNALFAVGNYESAAELYQSISKEFPTNSESCFNLALCMSRIQKPDLALILLKGLALERPSFCEIYYHLAKLYDLMGEYDEALDNYVATLALSPAHVPAIFNLGLLLSKLERHAEAVEKFNYVLSLRPGLANAHVNRGVSLEELGNC